MSAPWSQEEKDAAWRMHGEKRSSIQIGRALGRNPRSVRDMLQRLAAPRPPAFWTDEVVADVSRRFLSGESMRSIATSYRVTRNVIIGKVHRLGLAKQRAAASPPKGAAKKAKPTVLQARSVRKRSTPAAPAPEADHRPVRLIALKCEPVRLEDLTREACRYSVSTDADGHLFCGSEAEAGKPYCPDHCRIAYVPEKPSDRKRADRAALYFARRAA